MFNLPVYPSLLLTIDRGIDKKDKAEWSSEEEEVFNVSSVKQTDSHR